MEAKGLAIPSWEALVGHGEEREVELGRGELPDVDALAAPSPMMHRAPLEAFITERTFFMSERDHVDPAHSPGEGRGHHLAHPLLHVGP